MATSPHCQEPGGKLLLDAGLDDPLPHEHEPALRQGEAMQLKVENLSTFQASAYSNVDAALLRKYSGTEMNIANAEMQSFIEN